ncbi:hypothetical protein DJ83_14475 [Halorubrum ezzemoulense]|uniref:Uncharacterized protein n=1 Tax=Halorubrum ezzemoulense TaxID=337243 RepID=A0A256IQM6_HALEZ|nr:hypothetical protein DJ83_14475 [Halorubrum ezzemoulense]
MRLFVNETNDYVDPLSELNFACVAIWAFKFISTEFNRIRDDIVVPIAFRIVRMNCDLAFGSSVFS